ncbi:uncharacterized protein LOC142323231 [Lycorma delicatula]|uniref:uncharacterized protein LOC142323231 n=1 Tax=Lycorma delicatula TaxID=130591 RepID=UPI003F51A48F
MVITKEEDEDDDDYFEDDVVFDRQQLLIDSNPALHRISIKSRRLTIRRISSGKCTICLKTLGLCGAFFGLGLCVAIPDFTFSLQSSDVHVITGTSLFTNLLTARSLGYIIGSFIAGFLFDRYNRQFLLFLSLLLTSLFIVITPWCYTKSLLEINMMVLGITIGFLSTGGNVLCLDLWGRNSGPFMQALHFSFALGTMIAPLLAIPSVKTQSSEFTHTNNSISLSNFGIHYNNYNIVSNNFNHEYEENFSAVTFNRTHDLYQTNCAIKRICVNSSSYQFFVNSDQLTDKNNGTVFMKYKYKISMIKINNLQVSVYNCSILLPFRCINFGNQFLYGNNSYDLPIFLLDPFRSAKIYINNYTDFGYDKNNKLELILKADNSNINLFTDCSDVIILHKNLTSYCDYSLPDVNDSLVRCDIMLSCANLMDELAFNDTIVKHAHNFTDELNYGLEQFDYDTESTGSEVKLFSVEGYSLTNYWLTYLIAGAVIFIFSLLFFIFLCNNPRDPKSKQEEYRTKSQKASNVCVDIFLVPLTTWFLFLCVGLQATITQLLSLYALKIRNTLPSTSDNLQNIFSTSFTSMRFASVFFAISFSPDTLLVINIVTFTCGTFILTSLGNKSNEALCTGCSMIGLGLATMVPTTILWIEQYIRVSNKITVVFVVGSTLGEMLLPFMVYKLMISDSDMFLYVTILVNILTSITLICLWLLMGKCTQKFCLPIGQSGYRLANQNDEEDLKSMTNIFSYVKKA